MILVGIATVAPLAADDPPTPVGGELVVNQTTSGRQLNAAVTALGNGQVAVVWEGEDGDGRGIFGRRVDAQAQPVGDEFEVSVTTTGNQASARVAPTGDGGFVVVWENDSPGESSISSRAFDALGSPGPEILVASNQTSVDVFDPYIESLADGTFVVVWDEYDGVMLDGSARARFLDSDGDLAGTSFILDTDGTASNVYAPISGSRPGGGFLVAWQYNGGASGLWAESFTDAAAAGGTPIEVTSGSHGDASLQGLDGGGFMAVWRSGLSRAMRRTFDAVGNGGAEVEVSSLAGLQHWTDVTALPGGRAALTWVTNPDSDPVRIDAQLIGADSQVDSEWQVDSSVVSLLGSKIVYDTASAQLILAWTRRGSIGGDQEDIILRRYSLETPIFVDGFESGDFTLWSSVSP